jgi:3-hydroxyisobutyrate dehydrogenase-like beta-hydroxyacid dehydrogenase
MKIGFIGLGAMGRGFAARLIAAGHDVHVWNRSQGPVETLVKLGARAAESAADAAHCEVVHTMLADDAATRTVLFDGGVFSALAPGSAHVNHATISVAFARELAARHKDRGIDYVAAPVFGRPDAAAAGKLQVLAAGPAAAVARVRPLLETIGEAVWPLGEAAERANVVKIAGNFLIAAAIESMGEATALVRAEGVSAGDFLSLMTRTLFAAPVYQGYGSLIAEQRYQTNGHGFGMKLGFKDTRLTLAAAEEAQVPMPIAGVLRDSFLEALSHGDAELDWSALAEVSARRANLERRES